VDRRQLAAVSGRARSTISCGIRSPVDRIEACLRYYADYGDEVDEWIDRARAIAQREEARWHRRGEALAWSCCSMSTTPPRSPDSSAPKAMTSPWWPDAPISSGSATTSSYGGWRRNGGRS
jgi:hypothetical protein